ncbi:hypothetical protein BCR39DRAFT_546370 [Naematelia encephala]|uniref:Fumarylacetoacetase-like C-terminal domain-containing protein n=1 Tax=Naematelia encephala TaxID=71784 RepID=A0A1Y2AQH5_9TREE|nr:hypothetical protein BCR39DRAFT_546370 [Naematelia encephala]
MVSWSRLIRFVPAEDPSSILYGEPQGDDFGDIGALADDGRLKAAVIEVDSSGPLSDSAKLTETILTVGKLLGPLAPDDCTDIKCIGLNYKKHIEEAGRSLPPFPSLFIKPTTSLGDYNEVVPIPKCAQEGEADYEGEVCAIIGEDCKNVGVENALDYVVGYTAGDDVSARKWQRLKERAGGVPQWCFSKGFDKFAPLGPMIVSTEIIPDPSTLHMKVHINGEERQDTPVSDLVFDIPTLVSFLSQGTTLRRGTVIMTGTPGGVGCSGPEDKWSPLKDNDKIEISVTDIGTLRHTVKYE